MRKYLNFKQNKRGSGIVTVMVAVMFLSVFGSMLLMTSLTNFEMKTSDRKGKQNTFDVETVVNQIQIGFQDTISDSIEKSLKTSLVNYGVNREIAKDKFSSMMFDSIRGWKVDTGLKDESGDEKLVSLIPVNGIDENMNPLTLIRGGEYEAKTLGWLLDGCDEGKIFINVYGDEYSEENIHDNIYLRTFSDPAHSFLESAVEFVYNNSDENDPASAKILEKAVFKNVSVSYTLNGIESTITTDFTVHIPSITLSATSGGSSEISKFAFVCGGTLKQSIAGSIAIINGSAYAKNIELAGSSSMIFDNAQEDYEIIENEISVSDSSFGSPRIEFGENSYLWAGNINVKKFGKISLLGNTFVKNDLNLNSYKASAVLKGQYFGFGTTYDAIPDPLGNTKYVYNASKSSSSIVSNNLETSLDIGGLERLSLAGVSFINTFDDDEIRGANVPMGESVSIKPYQSLYYADCDDLVYTKSPGGSEYHISHNPAYYNELEDIIFPKLLSSTVWSGSTDSGVETTEPKGYADYKAYLRPVIKPAGSGWLVYYFVSFLPDDIYGSVDGSGKTVMDKLNALTDTYNHKTARTEDDFNNYVAAKSELLSVLTDGLTYDQFDSMQMNAKHFFRDYAAAHLDEITEMAVRYQEVMGPLDQDNYSLSAGGYINETHKSKTNEEINDMVFLEYLINGWKELQEEAREYLSDFNMLTKFLSTDPDAGKDHNDESALFLSDYDGSYNAVTKLPEDDLPNWQDERFSPYYYFVKFNKISSEIDGAKLFYESKNDKGSELPVNGEGNTVLKPVAVISNGDYVYDNGQADTIGLIVCNGNVTIKKNFTGIILCSGDLTAENNITIDNSVSVVQSSYKSLSEAGDKLGSYFNQPLVDIDIYQDEENPFAETSGVSSFVSFENWRKS